MVRRTMLVKYIDTGDQRRRECSWRDDQVEQIVTSTQLLTRVVSRRLCHVLLVSVDVEQRGKSFVDINSI